MKKFVLLLSVFSLVIVSCSSDADSLPVIVPLADSVVDTNGILLKKAIITANSVSGADEINFTYTGNKLNRITYLNGNYDVYIYTGDLITEIRNYNVDNTLSSTDDFHYNSSNKLIGRNDLGSGVYETSYVHNSNGTISFNDSGDSGVIYFQNGEIVRITKNLSGGGVSEDTYTYDGMNSPFKNIVGFDKMAFAYWGTGIFHNELTYHYTATGGITGTDTTTYTYNSNNFPITSTHTLDSSSDVITAQYFYQ